MALNVSPERLEALALGALAGDAGAVRAAAAAGLRPGAFQGAESRAAWQRALELVTAGKPAPSAKDFQALGAEVEPGALDAGAYVAALVSRDVARRARLALAARIPSLDADPQGSVRAIAAAMGELVASSSAHVGRLDADRERRMGYVTERRRAFEEGQPVGVPTGLPVFDDEGDGWEPGDLVVVVGIPTSGKSTLLTYFCAVAYAAGRRVLFLSPENSLRDIEWRADVILADLVAPGEFGFTLSDLRHGKADPEEYGRWLDRLGSREGWVTVDAGEHGSFSVDDVVSLAREHRPDVLAIDGFHLLTAGRGKSWETMYDAGKRVKGLAQGMGIPVLCVTQATREAQVVQEDAPEMHQTAYGNAINEDASRMIAMAKVRGNKLRRVFKVTKFRDGQEVHYRKYLEFDLDRGHIRQAEPRDAGGGKVEF